MINTTLLASAAAALLATAAGSALAQKDARIERGRDQKDQPVKAQWGAGARCSPARGAKA
jgi:hypothetical protein